MSLNDWIGELRSEGRPVQTGEYTLTPVSRALVVQIPGMLGGLVWNRPAYVRVSRPGEAERILPVRDVTRLAIFGIAAIALLGVLLARLFIRKETP
jgi:hypothetical protein